jgi:hypothetical protein
VSTALPAPRVPREQQREQMRRDRAAAQALRIAFPAVQQVRLELEFSGAGATVPASQLHVMHPPARAFFEFQCPYADCDGRFNLANAVEAALASPKLRATGTLECRGLRARDHLSKQDCALQLRYTVRITYDRER